MLDDVLLLAPRLLARATGALRMSELLRHPRVQSSPDLARAAAYEIRDPAPVTATAAEHVRAALPIRQS